MSDKRYIVGLDISLTSPGVCVLDRLTQEYTLFFARQRRRDPAFVQWSGPFKGQHITLKFVEMKSFAKEKKSSDLPRWAVYENKSTVLCNLIQQYPPETTELFIEGYSFMSQGGSAPTKLYEFGGVLRTKLFGKGYSLVEIPPTRIKALFSGSGRSKKIDMYTTWIALGLPNLYELFLFPKVPKNVPKPIEDVVDAFALCTICNFSPST